jgi:hypothetical protein
MITEEVNVRPGGSHRRIKLLMTLTASLSLCQVVCSGNGSSPVGNGKQPPGLSDLRRDYGFSNSFLQQGLEEVLTQ